MTENLDLHDKIMSIVKEYVASEEFNGKIKSFTKKTVQETVSSMLSMFWKYWTPLIVALAALMVWIFQGSINTLNDKLDQVASNQIEIVKIIAKLEERTK